MLADSPYLDVKGTLAGNPWSAQSSGPFLLFEPEETSDEDESKPKPDPHVQSLKIPQGVEDLTLDAGYPFQHLQIGSGPKLFGKSFRIPKFDSDHLDLKIYHYKATTLRIRLVDADGKPVAMPDNKLPNGISIKSRFVREEEVRKAGAEIEPADPKTSPLVWDNEAFLFVIPGEEIEITVTSDGKPANRRLTLNDGETRTAQLKLGPNFEWTETSKPTPKPQPQKEVDE
jgi:hypothetical protein